MDFENKLTHNGIHYSRYIASWTRVCKFTSDYRLLYFNSLFEDWLRSEGLNDEEIKDIVRIAINGKMELEDSVRRFLKAR